MVSTRLSSRLLLVALAFALVTCAPDFKDISDPNGRRAILDLATNYLTIGDCDAAIRTLDPLMRSQWFDNEVKLLYASAYGCKGGMNMGAQILTLREVSGSDIWTPLVKSNYSAGFSDGHVSALLQASDTLMLTSSEVPGYEARSRPADANTYMVFVQANVIASVISPLGVANSATGKKTQSIFGLGSIGDRCAVQVAFAMITDSLNYVSLGSAVTKLAESAAAACQAALGGPCPANKDRAVCNGPVAPGPALQAQGQLLINAIDTQWSF